MIAKNYFPKTVGLFWQTRDDEKSFHSFQSSAQEEKSARSCQVRAHSFEIPPLNLIGPFQPGMEFSLALFYQKLPEPRKKDATFQSLSSHFSRMQAKLSEPFKGSGNGNKERKFTLLRFRERGRKEEEEGREKTGARNCGNPLLHFYGLLLLLLRTGPLFISLRKKVCSIARPRVKREQGKSWAIQTIASVFGPETMERGVRRTL